MKLSPEALELRARTEAEAAQRKADIWNGRRPMVQGPRTLGSLALVTVGCQVWTDIERKRRGHDEALGGIVLEVVHRDVYDDDTGEIHDVKAWRCYDPIAQWGHAFRTIREDDVTQDGVMASAPWELTNAVRKFARVVGAGSGLLVGSEAQLVADAYRLSQVIMGGNR